MVMTQQWQEQRERIWKAKIAMALYGEYGKVPNERVIDEVFHLTRPRQEGTGHTHFTEAAAPAGAVGTILGKLWAIS
jgi:hypothetical protein